jgi:FkbH-like protein
MSDMPWLLPAPGDYRMQLKRASEDPTGKLLRLAKYSLDVGQLGKLSAAVNVNRTELAASGLFASMRLGVVSSHTTDYIVDALPASGLRHNLLLEVRSTPFGMVMQNVLDPASQLVGQVDAVLLSLDAKMLGLDRAQLDPHAGEAAIESALQTMRALRDGVVSNLHAVCVLETLPQPDDSLFGNFDRRVAGTPRSMVEAFNHRLVSEILANTDVLIDVDALAREVGLARWYDARGWHSAKIPFALDHVPLYSDHVARTLAALRGKSRKCLVLDLDNTIWGGVIGDDGLEGIKLGQGSAIGEAHVELQRYALELRDRGVILSICSKNDEANARLPFRGHPEMILKEDHIAAFFANWSDKASNLRDIAATLNIGTDALVFLDDSPAERAIIRRELPEVAVPEIGPEPADYIAAIARAGWFEAVAFSDEDRQRPGFYQSNLERRQAQGAVTNMADYLFSLEMKATLQPFDPVNRSRIAQLVNKSNQFNLTTRRYTEAEIASFENAAGKFTLQVRLVDRFGDNGMISVVIFDKAPEVWSCDTWLMSCRVLGRRVEEAALNYIATAARAEGTHRLRGTYLPTKKNSLVEKHFEKLGFSQVADSSEEGTAWELDLREFEPVSLPIVIV